MDFIWSVSAFYGERSAKEHDSVGKYWFSSWASPIWRIMIAQYANNQINNRLGFRLDSSSLFAQLWASPNPQTRNTDPYRTLKASFHSDTTHPPPSLRFGVIYKLKVGEQIHMELYQPLLGGENMHSVRYRESFMSPHTHLHASMWSVQNVAGFYLIIHVFLL